MSVDLNKTIAQASLDNLNDILVPEAIGFLPLAPGWIVVILLVSVLFFHVVFKVYKHYQKAFYRREALRELESYTKENRDEMLALLTLAKRVAIAAYGRSRIARLSGEKWWNFMEEHSKVSIDRSFRAELSDLLYDTSKEFSHSQYTAIKEFVRLWILTHQVQYHV